MVLIVLFLAFVFSPVLVMLWALVVMIRFCADPDYMRRYTKPRERYKRRR